MYGHNATTPLPDVLCDQANFRNSHKITLQKGYKAVYVETQGSTAEAIHADVEWRKSVVLFFDPPEADKSP